MAGGHPAASVGRSLKNHGSQHAGDVVLESSARNDQSAWHTRCSPSRNRTARPAPPLSLAQFKPALAMNPEILARYGANRLRVVRQVRYSVHNENALDLVLFLNGIPVATCELKSDFTQSRGGRGRSVPLRPRPTPRGQSNAEPLLSFPNGRWSISPSATWRS